MLARVSVVAASEERIAAEKLFGIAGWHRSHRSDRAAFIADLENALLAAKVAAYAQGFAVMTAASDEFGWSLPMPTIARIWRAGCIIRSQFLDDDHFGLQPRIRTCRTSSMTPAFASMVQGDRWVAAPRRGSWPRSPGSPIPALSSALSYFDTYRRGRGTANLIQAQRDFFGAHGFDRRDGKDIHHGPWAGQFCHSDHG